MLQLGKLKELIKNLDSNICVGAYEGERCGIQLWTEGEKTSGWIETGFTNDHAIDKRHDIDKLPKITTLKNEQRGDTIMEELAGQILELMQEFLEVLSEALVDETDELSRKCEECSKFEHRKETL